MPIDFTKYPLPRMRHHTSPNFYLPLSELKKRPRYYPDITETLDWKEVFKNGNPPDTLDIGCGRGRFLLEYAAEFPFKNILGMEVRNGGTDWIKTVIEGENLGNAAVLWYSVVNGMHFIDDNSIGEIVYFFPDPWPKTRHHKRRAFQEAFLKECHRVLKPDGIFYLMTDVPEVDEYQQEVLKEFDGFEFHYDDKNEWPFPFKTDQESFCLRKDIPYVRLICRKK
ncbi:MAG: tRNA (guanosine(46)-N7)-methyltransferase TrmB [Bacteroidota bacterium]